ncbi:transposable element Tcb1 transposase [Trichonephila clavipes]|nr:transposable element Tcb1 transposase [Trichonephila clavipes]
MANNQSVRRHLNAFTRGRIIGQLEEGRSVTSVPAEFGIAHSIVSRLWRQFQTTGTAIRGFSSGRPRGTTPADDRYIVLQARRNRRQTAGEIARHTTQATGRPLSRFTVARRLHGGDKSRFSLSSDSHRILIWRERGSRNHPSNIIERDKYGGRGVLVWGGIMIGSRTDLHIFDAGSVNGTCYCNEILLPYVRLFRGAKGLQFLFMDDNAPCHRTVATEQLLESEDIEPRTLPPVTVRELRLALQDEWAAVPQQLIGTLILSMGGRCETCLADINLPIQVIWGYGVQEAFPILYILSIAVLITHRLKVFTSRVLSGRADSPKYSKGFPYSIWDPRLGLPQGPFVETVEYYFQDLHIIATDASKNKQTTSIAVTDTDQKLNILQLNNKFITHPQLQADMFADYFASKNAYHEPLSLDFLCDKNNLLNKPFHILELHTAIKNSKNATSGADYVTAIFVKNLNQGQRDVILRYFQKLFDNAIVPDSWKHAIILPIPKPCKGKTGISSYRPIALTSVF